MSRLRSTGIEFRRVKKADEFGRVAVLMGGASAEREVSLMTGQAVLEALVSRGVHAAAFDPAERPLTELVGSGSDRVFIALHGPGGEDGAVQGALEWLGLPYTGSGVLGSAVGMDKVMMKRAFAACGLPQARYAALREGDDLEAFSATVVESLGLPCFVKPANMGSSVGVSKAHDLDEVRAAITVALDYDEWVVAEEAIVGREIEVAVLGDAPPEASLPGEVVPAAEFYDYADKYEDGRAQLLAPAPLTDAQSEAVRVLAVRAFEACRCDAMARVDFFLEEDGRGFLVNELNTIPGFTPISMYPKLWDVSGLPYSKLIDRLIDLAVERHERRTRRAGRQR
jgi:D-alanine-D-alanine ligase